jgi:nucleoside-diphosphate-sugar epimerase
MDKILIIGSGGQIGTELLRELRIVYGKDNVIASEHEECRLESLQHLGPWDICDVTDKASIEKVLDKHGANIIVNLAAILSATGERNPDMAWHVNINGLYNVLEIARERQLKQVLIPSSIAVFGPSTPSINTPQETVLKPTTMYGVTKVAGELLGDYYVRRFGADVRGLRYPGIISAETLPGGGTTDYAVAIFYEAIANGKYTCFVKEDTRLPMMYIPDCLKATIDLMKADFSNLKHHSDFNVGAMSFTVGELAAEIRKHLPSFEIDYQPDYRQTIADSWPDSVDDSAAREEWGWKPEYDLAAMTEDMLIKIENKLRLIKRLS